MIMKKKHVIISALAIVFVAVILVGTCSSKGKGYDFPPPPDHPPVIFFTIKNLLSVLF
jgi:hypothetical protein